MISGDRIRPPKTAPGEKKPKPPKKPTAKKGK
jgi:hypothetical protein